MKRNTISLIVSLLLPIAAAAQIGGWTSYPAYGDITKIVRAGTTVYAVATENLFAYNTSDGSVTSYDKAATLSSACVADIEWCSSVGCLIVVYDDYNIDLLDAAGDVVNVPDYRDKTLTYDKTINNVVVSGRYAYLCTGFGIVKMNVETASFDETYNMGVAVRDITVVGTTIYAATDGGVYAGSTTDNLADNAAWTLLYGDAFTHIVAMSNGRIMVLKSGSAYELDPSTGSTTYVTAPRYTDLYYDGEKIVCYGGPTSILFIYDNLKRRNIEYPLTAIAPAAQSGSYWIADGMLLVAADIADDDNTSSAVTLTSSGVRPDGPQSNYFGFMLYSNERLYSCPGGNDATRTAAVQVLDDGEWTVYDDTFVDDLGHRYFNAYAVAVDPKDADHVMVGASSGLYEFLGGAFVKNYTRSNSPLQGAATVNEAAKDNYTIVSGAVYDDDGVLWLANSIAPSASLFSLDDGTWTSHHSSALMNTDDEYSMDKMCAMTFDSRGLLWMGNNFWTRPALICYQPSTGGIAVYDDFVNQDGTSLTAEGVSCIAEDADGDIWLGTAAGPLVFSQSYIGSDSYTFEQPKIPRNDGTTYADYLLDGVSITAIAIDGAGRKWFGTESGAYLISYDNMTQEQHFTSDNSPLPSDVIEAIAIDGKTGRVFLATDKGLCSYVSDATDPVDEMDSDNVYAYPNPVRPDYSGPITVTGLSFDADVKICSSAGALMAEGRSTGGTFVWDGCDKKGQRVASGVYMVLTAKSDGTKGCVAKIAIVR